MRRLSLDYEGWNFTTAFTDTWLAAEQVSL